MKTFFQKQVPPLVLATLVAAVVACGSARTVETTAKTTAKTTVQNLERYGAIPQNADEFRNIFKKLPSAAEESELRDLGQRAQNSGVKILRATESSARIADQVENAIASRGNAITTVIGHNEAGNFFFNDGSSKSLAGLAGLVPQSSMLVVLSCESQSAVTGRAIGVQAVLTYAVAQPTEQKFIERINALRANGTTITIELAQGVLNKAFDDTVLEQKRAAQVKRYAFTGAGATVGGGAVVGISIRPA